jgi:hypothetical protein
MDVDPRRLPASAVARAKEVRMRKILATVAVGALLLGGASPALADPHPSEGATSEGRNEQGFGGGPHCHVLIENNTPFDSTPAFPSHTAHVASGFGHVFDADPDCDGIAG